jgi:serine/threonine-protein kinase
VLVLPFGTLLAAWGIGSTWGPGPAWTTFVLAMAGIPLTYLVRAARQLARQGFAHMDLAPAFASAVEESREEHALELAKGPSRAERLLGRVAYVFGPPAVGSFLTMIGWAATGVPIGNDAMFWLWTIFSLSGPVFIGSLLLYLGMLQARMDIDTEFWQRVWTGRIGRMAFKLGRKLLGKGAVPTAMTHRATELSLGLAAEQLFDALPKETRAALGDLPSVLRRLQEDAQRLRANHDALQEALNDAGDSAASIEYADVRQMRDDLHAKLGEAVGALETIRLNLLRLHAGSGTVEGLTTHVGLAAAVSEEVERLLAAKEEVARVLAFPRETAATPV